MKAFTLKLEEFFKLKRNIEKDDNFDDSKKKLLIPLYQREYKWTEDKVKVLLNDINQRDKFLGIIILDEMQNCYEIVDGQQRITTCFLTLIALYNYYKGSSMEQQTLLRFIKPYGEFVLANDTVGEYVLQDGDELKININPENDIYFQKYAFETSYELVFHFIKSLTHEKVREFKRQLLDCEILVMINNEHGATRPVEQIFLDINEKSQLLEVEDIFKGHCFENFDILHHEVLKNKWAVLKSYGMQFKEYFGFKDLSQYLYLYLLEYVDNNMPENLSPKNKHYLEGMNMDETLLCLENMIKYGESVINFRKKLNNSTYCFEDISKDSTEYKKTKDPELLKILSLQILDNKSAQYQKLPFMLFISFLSLSDKLKNSFTHLNFRKALLNLYVYASIFSYTGGRKSKKDIDRSVYNALASGSVDNVIEATKILRTDKVNTFELSENIRKDELLFVYTISDYYVSNNTWIKQTYVGNDSYTPEHFIIPDKRDTSIIWKNCEKEIKISLKDKLEYKKKTINYLIIDKGLNESMLCYDIITKIEMIKEWYKNRNLNMPKHISIVINTIEKMQQYKNLKKLKDEQVTDENNIKTIYIEFLESYFGHESEKILRSKLTEAFRSAFQNGIKNDYNYEV